MARQGIRIYFSCFKEKELAPWWIYKDCINGSLWETEQVPLHHLSQLGENNSWEQVQEINIKSSVTEEVPLASWTTLAPLLNRHLYFSEKKNEFDFSVSGTTGNFSAVSVTRGRQVMQYLEGQIETKSVISDSRNWWLNHERISKREILDLLVISSVDQGFSHNLFCFPIYSLTDVETHHTSNSAQNFWETKRINIYFEFSYEDQEKNSF